MLGIHFLVLSIYSFLQVDGKSTREFKRAFKCSILKDETVFD